MPPQSSSKGVVFVWSVVIALMCLGVYYKIFYNPNSAPAPGTGNKEVAGGATVRLDTILAQQNQARLDDELNRLQRGEQVDVAQIKKDIQATGKTAGELAELQREVEVASHGEISFPDTPAAQPAPNAPATPRPSPPAPPVRTPEEEARVAFFDSRVTLNSNGYGPISWTRVKVPPGASSITVQVDGEIKLERGSTDGRDYVGPKGLPLSHIPPRPYSRPSQTPLMAPEMPFLAALARVCDLEECGEPMPFMDNPWHFCVSDSKWLEFRINGFIRSNGVSGAGYNPPGHYDLRFQPSTAACEGM